MCGRGVHQAHDSGAFIQKHASVITIYLSFTHPFTNCFNSLKEQTETPLIVYFCAIHLLTVYNFIHYYLILPDIYLLEGKN